MKRILITSRIADNRDALDVRFGELFDCAGLLPLVVLSHYPLEKFLAAHEWDGLLLTGGDDHPQRSLVENALLSLAIAEKKPVMGICHGMQVIAKYFGAKLISCHGHVAVDHSILVNENSRYRKYLDRLDTVNSYHDFGIEEIGAELEMSARSGNIVEALEHPQHPIFGCMWHPERNDPYRKADVEFLRSFF